MKNVSECLICDLLILRPWHVSGKIAKLFNDILKKLAKDESLSLITYCSCETLNGTFKRNIITTEQLFRKKKDRRSLQEVSL